MTEVCRHRSRSNRPSWTRVLSLTILLAVAAAQLPAAVMGLEPESASLPNVARESTDVDAASAERLFASADAAIYFPDLGVARWIRFHESDSGAPEIATRGAAEWIEGVERDFPGFRSNRHGPFLLKVPAVASPTNLTTDSPPMPRAIVFTDSFEGGLSNWDLDDNTLGLYGWGTTTCESRTGSYSADAVRGGVNSLSCSDVYGSDVLTSMRHDSCESLAGASQAWLETFVHIEAESGYDTLGFFYADSEGDYYGYTFSGTWSAWFHLILNLKQWYRVGDVTATSCPRLLVQFSSDIDTEPGFGARIDDLLVSTSAPQFLACSINASPSSGAAPLTVSFTASVSGSSSSTAYQWSFGDADGTTATSTNASFTYTEPGTYRARLRVEEQGVRAYAHKTITVTSGPSCSLSCSATVPSTATAGTPVSFQATATASGCSQSPTYAWNFGNGQTSSQRNPTYTYPSPGTYSWVMTATANGQTCTRPGTITVYPSSSQRSRRRPVARPPMDDNAVAQGTIGPAGGTLSGSGFTITAPSGAFPTSQNLTVRRLPPSEREEGDVSDVFVIEGMPASLNKDLQIRIDKSGSGTTLGPSEQYYVSFEAPAYLKSREAEQVDGVMPFPIDATSNGNTIVATIPASWGTLPQEPAAAGKGSDRGVSMIAPDPAWDYKFKAMKRRRYETAHFYGLAMPSSSAPLVSILNLLEDHFGTLTGYGFSLACRVDASSGQFRKILVEPKDLGTGDTDAVGYHVSKGSPCGTGWIFNDYLEITTSYAVTDLKVRSGSAHELFHLVQDIYSPGGARANLWLKDASSVWLETMVGNLCPDVQSAYVMFTQNGLFNSQKSAVPAYWTSDREQRHGYGASFALLYEAARSGPSFIRVIWDNIRLGNGEIASFEGALGSSINEWWTRFSKDYFHGEVRGGCNVSWASFTREPILDASDASKSFAIDAYPLSSVAWSLDLQKFDSDTEAPVTIKAEGLRDGQRVYIRDMKSKTDLAELTRDNAEYGVDDLNEYAGSVLVFVFVDTNLPTSGSANSQSSSNKVTLKVGSEQYICWARYYVKTYKEPWGNEGGWTECTGNCSVYDGRLTENFLGSITGDDYYADEMFCEPEPEPCRWRDPNLSNVANELAFSFVNQRAAIEDFSLGLSFSSYGNSYEEDVVVYGSIPRLSSSENAFEYKLTGAGLCSSVSITGTRGVYAIECDASSYFQVSCTKNAAP